MLWIVLKYKYKSKCSTVKEKSVLYVKVNRNHDSRSETQKNRDNSEAVVVETNLTVYSIKGFEKVLIAI